MKYTCQEIVEILTTVKNTGYRRFHVASEDFVLEVSMDAGGQSAVGQAPAPERAAPSATPQTTPAASPVSAPAVPAPSPTASGHPTGVPVRAPMAGTFYRAPSPDTPPFVEVGSVVAADDTVCLIEVMKLFNSIPAGVAGTVVAISAENEGPVTNGEAVIWIEPS